MSVGQHRRRERHPGHPDRHPGRPGDGHPDYDDEGCLDEFDPGAAAGKIVVCVGSFSRNLRSFNVFQAGGEGMILHAVTKDLFTDNFWLPTVMVPPEEGTSSGVPRRGGQRDRTLAVWLGPADQGRRDDELLVARYSATGSSPTSPRRAWRSWPAPPPIHTTRRSSPALRSSSSDRRYVHVEPALDRGRLLVKADHPTGHRVRSSRRS